MLPVSPEILSTASRPVVIIVTGSPGTGKTTLAQRLAEHFCLPLIAKDAIKEHLYDALGYGEIAWSRKLSRASIMVLYGMLESLLAAGVSCVIEANFWRTLGTEDLLPLVRRYKFWPIQVVCCTDPAVLQARLRQRAISGERHPGHHDDPTGSTSPEDLERFGPLDIGGAVIGLDTTDFGAIDYGALYARIASSPPNGMFKGAM